jgi:hypothetical protein
VGKPFDHPLGLQVEKGIKDAFELIVVRLHAEFGKPVAEIFMNVEGTPVIRVDHVGPGVLPQVNQFPAPVAASGCIALPKMVMGSSFDAVPGNIHGVQPQR